MDINTAYDHLCISASGIFPGTTPCFASMLMKLSRLISSQGGAKWVTLLCCLFDLYFYGIGKEILKNIVWHWNIYSKQTKIPTNLIQLFLISLLKQFLTRRRPGRMTSLGYGTKCQNPRTESFTISLPGHPKLRLGSQGFESWLGSTESNQESIHNMPNSNAKNVKILVRIWILQI